MRKNIFKKLALLSTFVVTSVFASGYTPVSGDGNPDDWDIDNSQFVYDYADILTDEEELELQSMCESVGKKLGMDIVRVSSLELGHDAPDGQIEGIENSYGQEYITQFYVEGDYAESGIIYLMDIDYDGIYIARTGLAQVYIDDYDNEKLLDAVWEGYYDYDYIESAETFIEEVEDMVGDRKDDSEFEELEKLWNEGGYDDYDEFMGVYSDKVYEAYEDTFFTKFQNPFLCMIIGAVIALIAVLIMCFSSRPKMTAGSRTYLKNGSLNILHRFDRFTHTTTTTRQVNTSSGSGGGGSRGGSSSFRSGGRSFSGGGRSR